MAPLAAEFNGDSAQAGGSEQAQIAVGDLVRAKAPARLVPLRGVVDHAEQRDQREALVEARRAGGVGLLEGVLDEALERLTAVTDGTPLGA